MDVERRAADLLRQLGRRWDIASIYTVLVPVIAPSLARFNFQCEIGPLKLELNAPFLKELLRPAADVVSSFDAPKSSVMTVKGMPLPFPPIMATAPVGHYSSVISGPSPGIRGFGLGPGSGFEIWQVPVPVH